MTSGWAVSAVWRLRRKVDAASLPSTPRLKIYEVSRLASEPVCPKSKLLAQEMPDLHTGGWARRPPLLDSER